jgi:hypothetical protein
MRSYKELKHECALSDREYSDLTRWRGQRAPALRRLR